jgi:hypothetical protein
MLCIAALARPGGVMTLLLGHGPVPAGRRILDVTPTATIAVAQAEGVTYVQRSKNGGGLVNGPAASWDRLAFAR